MNTYEEVKSFFCETIILVHRIGMSESFLTQEFTVTWCCFLDSTLYTTHLFLSL